MLRDRLRVSRTSVSLRLSRNKSIDVSWGRQRYDRENWFDGDQEIWIKGPTKIVGCSLTRRHKGYHDHHGVEFEATAGRLWLSIDFYDHRHADRLEVR